MKKSIIVLLLIVTAGAGSPYWVGQQIEEKIPEFLERAAQVGQFNVELTSYDRGVFRSTATTTISFQGVKTEKIVLQHSIWHGPLPIGQTLTGGWHVAPAAAVIESTLPSEVTQQGMVGELLELLPGFSAFHEVTVLSLAGDATSNITIPAFEQQLNLEGDKANFEWGGLVATEHFNADLSEIEGEATLSRIGLSDPSMEGEITALATTFRIHEDASGLLLGNVTLDSDTISFGSRGLAPEFSVKGFQLRNAARLEDGLVSYAVEIAADQFNNPTLGFAPVGFEVLFSHLDAATILDVQRQLQNLQTDMVNLSEDEILQQIAAIYLNALPELLRKSPEISLNYLRARNADGELWAKGNIALRGDETADATSLDDLTRLIQAQGETQIESPLLLALTGKTLESGLKEAWETGQLGNISEQELHALIATRSQQQIDALVAQGLLAFDGKNYSMVFSYQNRQATLNGQVLPD